jgi:hypothetical protein
MTSQDPAIVEFRQYTVHPGQAFAAGGRWAREAAPALAPCLARPPEPHRLAPTPRSALRA